MSTDSMFTLVYVLYQQRKWLAILLISLLGIEFVVAIIGVGVTLSKHHFVPLDIVRHLPNSFEYFGYVLINISIEIAKKPAEESLDFWSNVLYSVLLSQNICAIL